MYKNYIRFIYYILDFLFVVDFYLLTADNLVIFLLFNIFEFCFRSSCFSDAFNFTCTLCRETYLCV